MNSPSSFPALGATDAAASGPAVSEPTLSEPAISGPSAPGSSAPGSSAPGPAVPKPAASPYKGRIRLVLLIAICIAPVLASYFAYYVMPPRERTNYGELIDPQRPVPMLGAVSLHTGQLGPEAIEAVNGRVVVVEPEEALDPLRALRGRWILLAVDGGGCAQACAEKLFFARQTQASLGRDRGRVARVLILADQQPLDPRLLDAHPDLTVLRVPAERLRELLPVPEGGSMTRHLYLIDPLHNLMMRFPENPEPAGVRRDLQKLLRASRIG